MGLITRAAIVDAVYSGLWEDYEPEDDILEHMDFEIKTGGDIHDLDHR